MHISFRLYTPIRAGADDSGTAGPHRLGRLRVPVHAAVTDYDHLVDAKALGQRAAPIVRISSWDARPPTELRQPRHTLSVHPLASFI